MSGAASTYPRLAIVGDVAMELADPEQVLARMAPFLRASAISFCNCEWPLTDRGAPWPGKAGRVVRSTPGHVRTYEAGGFDVVGLANNHMMNYGSEGLLQTLEVLDAAGIRHCGAGRDVDEAHRPAIVEAAGCRVAFLAYTSVFTPGFEAREDRPGVAVVRVDTTYRVSPRAVEMPGSPQDITTTPDPGDLERVRHDIAAARRSADAVVVSWHWGVSMGYQHLVPYQTELGRTAIDAGADLVVGHHPHTLQGIEVYRDKVIAYSLAHCGFDMEHASFSDEAVLVEVALQAKGLGTVAVRPIVSAVERPELVDVARGRSCLSWLERLSLPLGTEFVDGADRVMPRAALWSAAARSVPGAHESHSESGVVERGT